MMNTIILNGQNSEDITGLLIQNLPPISKPAMRTEIEQIDGRDGDIVTKLGYSSLTKQFSIGLYGDYDIDEVIAFFNSEGTVTFSNEPEKYYYYQILDQIDFDKLIRFKTASVSMHVQPFKYSNEESALVFQIENISTNSITIENVGNIYSRPTITLYGTGTVNLSLNGDQIFVMQLGSTPTSITIDTSAMEAYQGTPDVLMNRSVDGDYNNFMLNVGKSTISWSGNVTRIIVDKYSRWI